MNREDWRISFNYSFTFKNLFSTNMCVVLCKMWKEEGSVGTNSLQDSLSVAQSFCLFVFYYVVRIKGIQWKTQEEASLT